MKGFVLAVLGVSSVMLTVQAVAQFSARDFGLLGETSPADHGGEISITRGTAQFASVGCAGCHTSEMRRPGPSARATSDLLEIIRAHRSPTTTKHRAGEANAVVDRFDSLPEGDRQDLLNFLRSL